MAGAIARFMTGIGWPQGQLLLALRWWKNANQLASSHPARWFPWTGIAIWSLN
jgi:hypothetical protein